MLGVAASAAAHRTAAPKRCLREVEVATWDAIRSRRNVQSYSERAITPQDLGRILEAARRTPSAGNQQAWDFVVCSTESRAEGRNRAPPFPSSTSGSTTLPVVPTAADRAPHRP
jgi:hypothetical protein